MHLEGTAENVKRIREKVKLQKVRKGASG